MSEKVFSKRNYSAFPFLNKHECCLFSSLQCFAHHLSGTKANSSDHMEEGRRGAGGEVAHESKELQQDDSNPKSLF